MTSKHHRWQTRWRIDLAAALATHDSGLIVRFTELVGQRGAWDGVPVDNPEVFAQLLAKHGPHNIGPHIERLKREASQLYKEAQNAGH